jgi:hypothetical protein
MGATGLLAEDPRHASALVAFASDMFQAAASVRDPSTGQGVRVSVWSDRQLFSTGITRRGTR